MLGGHRLATKVLIGKNELPATYQRGVGDHS